MSRLYNHSQNTEAGASQTAAASAKAPLSIAAVIRNNTRDLVIVVAAIVAVVCCSIGFNVYLDRVFYEESADHIQAAYKQVATTFELFANRNWSLISNWENSLKYVQEPADIQGTWDYYADLKETWHYSDIYLFNENNDYVCASRRSGTADSIQNTFAEMYETGQKHISSYIASSGVRKIVFSQPLTNPVTIKGVTYTGVAISYDNEYVQGLVAARIYDGKSDCYVVKQSGEVCFSLQPKNEITDFVSNVSRYLKKHATFSKGTQAQFANNIANEKEGSALITCNGKSLYMVYQPVGVFDWSIVSFVDANEAEAELNNVRNASIVGQMLVSAIVVCGGVVILVGRYRERITSEERGRRAAERGRDMTLQLLNGMTEIADRYAVADLTTGEYEYHEYLLSEGLYPEHGHYDSFIEALNKRYAVLTEDDDAKISRLLNTKALRERLRTMNDRLKIEYAARTGGVYMLMTAVPLAFDEEGELERVLLIGQDIGLRKELESAANTDGLTGLFNERYFSNILHIKRRKNIPFTLFYLDLDRFKPVNDTYGHDTGDKLLQAVGKRMLGCIRSDDFAFRIGGDEFALVITGGLDDDACERMRERIETSISKPYEIEGKTIEVGTSCGYASWPRECANTDDVRILADGRMYANKSEHHNAEGKGAADVR